MTQLYDWQGEVGRKWARLHALTDRAFTGLTQNLLDRLERLPGNAVLDIGCGAGELSLALARQRPQAQVVGIDVSADLVAAATARAGDRANVTFIAADAASWNPDGFRPDLLTSRHGVMFFADPVAAFAHLRAIADPGASLLFSCFRDRRLNPWTSELAALLPPEFVTPADPLAPGPFAFADPSRVEQILAAAGWREVRCEAVDFAYVVGMGEDPLADARAFLGEIGPAAPAIAQMRGTPAEAPFHRRMTDWLSENAADGMVSFPAAAWIVFARGD
jgi:ubiquinone/menaquinone biosynthesis C-methylase UbiE